ncbi:MAG TPA: flagellar export chaperone FliS [Pirellulaceae bacterium]|jgi:flagellar biosynthetic protein FliS|nr:flagellar export chaperone FliS [Pirellulaceae bacterium]
MSNVARDRYLEGRIQGASGPRLRSMLVDRAYQLTRSVAQALAEQRFEEISADSAKLRAILRELFVTVDAKSSETARHVRTLYEYLYETTTLALLRRNVEELAQVEELLRFEAETWRTVATQHENREADAALGPFSASA